MAKDEEREEQEPEHKPEAEEPEDELEAEAAQEEEARPKAAKRRRGRRQRREPQPRRVMREEVPQEAPLLKLVARYAIGAGVAVLALGLIWWVVAGAFTWPARILVIVGGLAVIGSLYVLHEEIAGSITRQGAFSFANTTVALLAVLGILVLANYVSLRYVNAKWDSTAGKRFSLAEQSKEVVKSLDRKVELVGFYDMGSEYGLMQAAQAKALFSQYDEVSAKLVTYVYDVRKDAAKAKEYGITNANEAIAKSGSRQKEIYTIDEQEVTNAIAEVTTDVKPKLYFLSGHGERGLDPDELGRAYSKAKTDLQNQQYEVGTLNLLTQEAKHAKIPDDCKCLVILGPRSKLNEKEVTAVKNYLTDAGRAFIALGPPPDSPDLAEVIGDYGVSVLPGHVRDRVGFQSVDVPAPQARADTPVTRAAKGFYVFMELPRPLKVTEQAPEQPQYPGAPPPAQAAQGLYETSSLSWEQEGAGLPTGQEPKGPFAVVVAVDKRPEGQPPPMPGGPPPNERLNTRLVVVGTANLADDTWTQIPGNRTLFLSAIAWLAQRTQFISVPPKTQSTRNFAPTAGQAKLIRIVTIIVVPLLVGLAGIVVWWRRR